MTNGWDASRRAYADAAAWLVRAAALVGDRWERPGLGAWDVRALVGHASRSFLTVEEYLARPAAAVEVASAPDYYRAVRALASGPGVVQRGRDAGAALGEDPAAAVAALAARVVRLVEGCDGTELLTTLAGGMRLDAYLPTRTVELAVHGADLAAALGLPPDVPATAAREALAVVVDLAVADGTSGPLLLTATGRRTGLPPGASVL
ncbi:maleylpyruvate isomerase N-terminal domain-containing protein [Vallicoccus soli]|uniref:Mycothiol-dependent maleylpyruvate isomerase metal-binding domain-containing protein n=1 Tax=Vallicoccus soli TaxID=2339232 RepID=A0A3A3Z219_9ACTN|nr:maleylpyruvate isomerase N-terminal domain-containing protein [Vallicoccus soli]RJK97494.1 hypothetical protein D5H78_00095 [Vallicoccus soli]